MSICSSSPVAHAMAWSGDCPSRVTLALMVAIRPVSEIFSGDRGRRGIARDDLHLVTLDRVVVKGSGRRAFLAPHLDVGKRRLERRVEALGTGADRRHLVALAEVPEEVFGRRLVGGERPDPKESGICTAVAATRASRHVMVPKLGCHVRGLLLGDRPGARRIVDRRPLAFDDPAIVGNVLPFVDVLRHVGGQLLEELERGPGAVGIDRDVALPGHQLRAERQEQGCEPHLGIRCLAIGLPNG